MSEGNIPIDYNFSKHQISKKWNYDKMSVITFLSFRSTRFSMLWFSVAMFDRKAGFESLM